MGRLNLDAIRKFNLVNQTNLVSTLGDRRDFRKQHVVGWKRDRIVEHAFDVFTPPFPVSLIVHV